MILYRHIYAGIQLPYLVKAIVSRFNEPIDLCGDKTVLTSSLEVENDAYLAVFSNRDGFIIRVESRDCNPCYHTEAKTPMPYNINRKSTKNADKSTIVI